MLVEKKKKSRKHFPMHFVRPPVSDGKNRKNILKNKQNYGPIPHKHRDNFKENMYIKFTTYKNDNT